MVCMSIRQVPELLGQTEAVLHMFWRYKIFCHFNAAVQIMDLKIPYQMTDTSRLSESYKTHPPPLYVRFFHIYLSETGTEVYLISHRIASNSKTRTKYTTSQMLPTLPHTLVFPKANSLLSSILSWNSVPLAEVSLHRNVFPPFTLLFFFLTGKLFISFRYLFI